MLLAIDVGNTNTKFAVYDGEEQRGAWRFATDVKRTADEYGAALGSLFAHAGLGRDAISRAIIASVVPDTTFNLVTLCRRYFTAEPRLVGDPALKLGMKILIDRPEELGADRIINAVAAYRRFGGPIIIVDFGTATTFDSIDGNGDFRGAIIAPGINLSLQALYMAAAKLPRVPLKKPERVIATTTVPAMQSGVFWGYVGLIEGIVARMRDEIGSTVPVVATGGLAPMFAGATEIFDHVADDLALWGLVLIDRLNQG